MEKFKQYEYQCALLLSLQQIGRLKRVYVKDLDLFVTGRLLEDTLPVLSLGHFFENHGYSFEWTGSQKPHLFKNDKDTMQHRELHTYCLSRSVEVGFQFQCGTSANCLFIT